MTGTNHEGGATDGVAADPRKAVACGATGLTQTTEAAINGGAPVTGAMARDGTVATGSKKRGDPSHGGGTHYTANVGVPDGNDCTTNVGVPDGEADSGRSLGVRGRPESVGSRGTLGVPDGGTQTSRSLGVQGRPESGGPRAIPGVRNGTATTSSDGGIAEMGGQEAPTAGPQAAVNTGGVMAPTAKQLRQRRRRQQQRERKKKRKADANQQKRKANAKELERLAEEQ